MATDFSVDRDYPGWGVQLLSVYTAPPRNAPAGTLGTTRFTATVTDETRAVGFSYVAATRTYTARWFEVIRDFGPATPEIFDGFLPSDRVGNFEFVRTPFRVTIQLRDYTRYAGTISWSTTTSNGNAIFDSETRDHSSVFGTTTQPSDLPNAGTSVYRLNPNTRLANVEGSYGINSLQLTVDWATGDVSGTWTIDPAGTTTTPLTFAVSGRLNLGSSRLSATITGSGYSGRLSGAVFGPRAREIGFAYAMSNGTGGVISGTTSTLR